MWYKLIVQTLGVEQHFHGVEADAAAVSVLLRGGITPIKRVEDVLKLLLGERLAGVFNSQLILVASNFYDASGVAVAHRV